MSVYHSLIPQNNGSLRDYQIKGKKDILNAWDNVDSVMFQMPTGTGKTYLFSSLIKDLKNYYDRKGRQVHILIVVHRLELVVQISESLRRFGVLHGIIQGDTPQSRKQNVQVASIQSAITDRNLPWLRSYKVDYILIDEAHHSLAKSYKDLFRSFPGAKKLGLTATPWRMNNEPFTSLYDQLITTPQITEFIDNGYLVDFAYVSIKPNSSIQHMIDNVEVSSTGDYVIKELDENFNVQSIRAKLYDSYLKYARGRQGFVFAINKEHAANIAALYSANGVKSVAIDCDTPENERKQLVDKFKLGEIQVLVNVNIFTEGFDCPAAQFVQLARPTKSLGLYLQQVGRGLRTDKSKSDCIILDNVGMYNAFGYPDEARDWQSYFLGKESNPLHCGNSAGGNSGGKGSIMSSDPDFTEGDEEMAILRNLRTGDAFANVNEMCLYDQVLKSGYDPMGLLVKGERDDEVYDIWYDLTLVEPEAELHFFDIVIEKLYFDDSHNIHRRVVCSINYFSEAYKIINDSSWDNYISISHLCGNYSWIELKDIENNQEKRIFNYEGNTCTPKDVVLSLLEARSSNQEIKEKIDYIREPLNYIFEEREYDSWEDDEIKIYIQFYTGERAFVSSIPKDSDFGKLIRSGLKFQIVYDDDDSYKVSLKEGEYKILSYDLTSGKGLDEESVSISSLYEDQFNEEPEEVQSAAIIAEFVRLRSSSLSGHSKPFAVGDDGICTVYKSKGYLYLHHNTKGYCKLIKLEDGVKDVGFVFLPGSPKKNQKHLTFTSCRIEDADSGETLGSLHYDKYEHLLTFFSPGRDIEISINLQ